MSTPEEIQRRSGRSADEQDTEDGFQPEDVADSQDEGMNSSTHPASGGTGIDVNVARNDRGRDEEPDGSILN